LYDKSWYHQSSSLTHYFASDGIYGKSGGSATWNWVNNSDTLVIKGSLISDDYNIIEWVTDTEMSLRSTEAGSKSAIFKTTR
jgi:hypothetical protein